MPLKDADLYGMLMRRPVDQRKGLLKVSISYIIYQDPALRRGNGCGDYYNQRTIWNHSRMRLK